MTRPPRRKLTETEFAATFTEAEGGVLAEYVVTFPFSSNVRPQRGSQMHATMADAKAWIRDQAARRGLKPKMPPA